MSQFGEAVGCLERMKASPGWSDSEIVEFQLRVVRAFMERERKHLN